MNIPQLKTIYIKTIIVLSTSLIIYWRDLLIIFNESINSELSSHTLIIPLLMGYIIYIKRDLIKATIEYNENNREIINNIYFKDLIGAIICIIALLIRWHGSFTFNSLEYHVASLPIFITGLTLLIFNLETLKVIKFPLFLSLFLIPPPFEITQQIGGFLAVLSALVSFNILKLAGYPVTLANEYGNPIIYLIQRNGTQIPFTIDIGCSGLYSFIGLLVFAVFFSYISKGSILRKGILLVSGFPILYSLNIVRISLLLLVGYYYGIGAGLNLFHLLGGWTLTFLGTLIILLLSEKILKIEIYRKKASTCEHESLKEKVCVKCGKILKTENPPIERAELIKYLLIILVIGFVATIDVPSFSINSGKAGIFIQSFSGQTEILSVLPEIKGYQLDFVYRDTNFEEISGQNSSLLFVYYTINSTEAPVWVQVETSSVKNYLHNWEYCLIKYPTLIGNRLQYESVDQHDIHLLENPPLSARYFSFHENNESTTQVVLYWFSQSVFQTDKGYHNMWSKISVIQYVDQPEYYVVGENNILPVAREIAEYWSPITSWSEVTLSIAKFGPINVGAFLFLLLIIIGYSLRVEMLEKKRLESLYSRIIDPIDKKIIDYLSQSSEKYLAEPELLLKFMENEIQSSMLSEKLFKAKELGLIKRKIVNINDDPYFVWSRNF